jgi:hypothetical protein
MPVPRLWTDEENAPTVPSLHGKYVESPVYFDYLKSLIVIVEIAEVWKEANPTGKFV